MSTEKKKTILSKYGQGRYSVLHEMIEFVKKEIIKAKERKPEPNSPQQISNGGQLRAYNRVLQKLKCKKINTENHQP
jgi:hypothetical protein